MSHLRYVHPSHIAYDIQRGLYPGKSMVTLRAFNDDVDAPAEDLIPWGGDYAFQSAAVAMEVISSSASDDGSPVGVGARTVFISGLDGSFAEISETVTLNGVTAVPLVNLYRRINSFEVLTVGSSNTNVGTLNVRVIAGAVIQAQIAIGESTSRTGVYTVPAAKTAYIYSAIASLKRVTNETIEIIIRTRNQAVADSPIVLSAAAPIIGHGSGTFVFNIDFKKFVGPYDIWMRAQLATGLNNSTSGRVNMIQEDS